MEWSNWAEAEAVAERQRDRHTFRDRDGRQTRDRHETERDRRQTNKRERERPETQEKKGQMRRIFPGMGGALASLDSSAGPSGQEGFGRGWMNPENCTQATAEGNLSRGYVRP